MALDYRALVSRGFWNEDATTSDQRFCYLLSMGLWENFAEMTGRLARFIGLQFDNKFIG